MPNPSTAIDPIAMLRPRRKIVGMSAILLPFDARGRIDWDGFRGHCRAPSPPA